MAYFRALFNEPKVISASLPLISGITHPDYDKYIHDWAKFKLVWDGGTSFKNAYLKKHSKREEKADYDFRKSLTPVPAHAKTSVLEVRNSIYQRMADISRKSTSTRYLNAVDGKNGGIDRKSSTMNKFIGDDVLTPLLVYGRVGVLVDSPSMEARTKLNTANLSPYASVYLPQDIRSWRYEMGVLTSLLLREYSYDIDTKTGLTNKRTEKFLLFKLEDGRVRFQEYEGMKQKPTIDMFLDIPNIPFHIFDVGHSLLSDVADHQIALLNLGSQDIAFSIRANFPFLTEQQDIKAEQAYLRNSSDAFTESASGSTANASEGKNQDLNVGITRGRRYGKGLDRPGFIHPSPEPMKVSMLKQKDLIEETKDLVLLRISSLNPDETKQGLEAGLSFIGLTLQYGEQRIADIFTDYETTTSETYVTYPTEYTVKSDKDRRDETNQLYDLAERTPSITGKKMLISQGLENLTRHRFSSTLIEEARKEILDAEVLGVTPDDIRADVEIGLLDKETASQARLYPKGSVAKAKVEHIERIKFIQAAQTSQDLNASARGIDDLDTGNDGARGEKTLSQDRDQTPNGAKRTRGDAK